MLYIKLFIEREKNIGQSAPECPFNMPSAADRPGISHWIVVSLRRPRLIYDNSVMMTTTIQIMELNFMLFYTKNFIYIRNGHG